MEEKHKAQEEGKLLLQGTLSLLLAVIHEFKLMIVALNYVDEDKQTAEQKNLKLQTALTIKQMKKTKRLIEKTYQQFVVVYFEQETTVEKAKELAEKAKKELVYSYHAAAEVKNIIKNENEKNIEQEKHEEPKYQ